MRDQNCSVNGEALSELAKRRCRAASRIRRANLCITRDTVDAVGIRQRLVAVRRSYSDCYEARISCSCRICVGLSPPPAQYNKQPRLRADSRPANGRATERAGVRCSAVRWDGRCPGSSTARPPSTSALHHRGLCMHRHPAQRGVARVIS